MQKTALTIFGALLISGLAVQMATASEHHRTGRGHHRWDRAYNQLRDPSFAARQMRDGYGEGGGLSKPAANETRSCDILWCYPD